MSSIERTVFISYRRTDVAWARLIFDRLQQDGFDVFFDFTGISNGSFARVILDNVRARAHFIVLLTPTTLDRCREPDDWVRREIETALEHRRNIVPVLLDGFSFADATAKAALSGSLARLREYNGLSLPMEYLDAATARLREFLQKPTDAVLHPLSDQAAQITHNTITAASSGTAAASSTAHMTPLQQRVLRIVRDAGTASIALTVTEQEEAEMRPIFASYGKKVEFRRPGKTFGGLEDDIRPRSLDVPPSGGRRTIFVSFTKGKSWSATTEADWILLPSRSSGTGFGEFTYEVLANKGGARTGTIRIGDKLHDVTQARAKRWYDF